MSIFEAMMLICFGLAWPMSIYRSYTSRTAKGKSIAFSYAILVGYAAGITHKILYSPDIVLWLYVFNFVMVMADTLLYYRNLRLDRQRDAQTSDE